MISKRSLGCELRHVPLAKRFRRNLADTYLGNELSASRTVSLAGDAVLAGTQNVADIATAAHPKNQARDLMRKLLK